MNSTSRQVFRIGGLLVFSLVGAAIVTAVVLYLLFRFSETPRGWLSSEVAVQPGLSLLLPGNGKVSVRWVSPPLEPVLAARAGMPQLAVGARGNPWLLHDGVRLISPAAQATVALSQTCRDIVGLPNGALLVATETEWGFLVETREADEGAVALPSGIFQPVAALPVPRCRLFAGAAGQLYFTGFNENTREQLLYRIAPEPIGATGPAVLRRYEQIFASGQAIGAAGGDAEADYFAVADTIYRRAAKGGAIVLVHRQALEPITGLAVDPVGGTFFATANGVFRLNEGGALPVMQVAGAQIVARDGSLFVLVPSCVGVLALDHVAEFGHASAELAPVPAPLPTALRVDTLRLAAVRTGSEKLERGDTFERTETEQIDCEVRLTRPSKGAKPEPHVLVLHWGLPGGRTQAESREFEMPPGEKRFGLNFSGLNHHGRKYYPGSYTVTASLDAGAPVRGSFTVTGEPDLPDAVLVNDVEAARRLLQAGADANGTVASRQPLLLAAIDGGSAAMTELLLKYGANVELTDEAGRTPLFHAVEEKAKESPEKVRLLLAYRASVEARDREGFTPLAHGVTRGGNRAAVEVLLANHASPNVADDFGRPPLLTLMQMTGVDEWQETFVPVLLRAGADANAEGVLPALLRGSCSTPCVRALIEAGADVNATAQDPRAEREEPSSCLGMVLATYRANMESNRSLAQRAMAATQLLIDADAHLRPDETEVVIEPEFSSWLDERFLATVLRGDEALFTKAVGMAFFQRLRALLMNLLMERLASQVERANTPEELRGLLTLCSTAHDVTRCADMEATVRVDPRLDSGPTLGLHVVEIDGISFVARVAAGSPAASAGLVAGDIIATVGGESFSGDAGLERLLAILPSGAPVEVEYRRDNDVRSPELYFWCGALERQLGQPDEAEVDLRIFLRLGQNPEALAQARAWLAELENR